MPKSLALPAGDTLNTKSVTGAQGDSRLLADALRAFQADDPGRAAALTEAFLALYPNNAEGLHLGGVIALQQGRAEIGVSRLRQAAGLEPRSARTLADFGLALEMSDQRVEAEAAYRAALAIDPRAPQVMLNLSRLLDVQARDDEAASVLIALVKIHPNMALAHSKLANLQLRLTLPQAAIACAQRALAIEPNRIDALQTLAAALDTTGQADRAVEVRQRIIRLMPESGFAQAELGMTQMHHGWLAEAGTSFRRAIALDPKRGNWYRNLSHVTRHMHRDTDISAMEALHNSNDITPDDRMQVCFGLGKALDDIGAYDEAFNYFVEGNGLKRARLSYSSEDTDRLFDKMRAVFTPKRFEALAGCGLQDATPIFVLGTRSSTSLIEQVLASHPEVTGGGEFRLINQLVGELASGPGFPLEEALDRIDDGTLRQMGLRYVTQVRQLAPAARFITDKLPGNFIMIGMIKLMLPHARVIHCRRNPVDNCLSLFKNLFAAEHLRYAYDLEEIGHYYTRYLDLMEHWHRVLPGFVHDVTYEDLVGDFDAEGRRLVEYCGLDWRDECRQFFNTRRSVQTASSAQVRQPIYATSIGQGARYGDRLTPLLQALGQ
jgi:tetratricopeptide (TPR) repeat protein